MPIKVNNPETGKEEEVFTQEEVNTATEAASGKAVEKYKEDNPDKAKELEEAQKEAQTEKTRLEGLLKEANEKLENLPEGDKNWAEMRQTVKDLTTKLGETNAGIEEKINVVTQGATDSKLELVAESLGGDDEEIRKQIKHHFNTTLKSVEHKTLEQFKDKVRQAYLLATGGSADENRVGPAVISAAGGAVVRPTVPAAGGTGKKLSSEVVDLGKKHFGLTDKDYEEHDKQNFSDTK